MKNNLKNIMAALLLCLMAFPIAVNADALKGRVVDAETGEPLVMAIVKGVISTGYGSFEDFVETDSLGNFEYKAAREGRIILTFSMIGYKNHSKANYVYGDGSEEVLNLGTIKLQPTALMLQGVEVKANVPRVTMSGDTIVFNPSAFKMQDGDRLAELIRKLPGVQRDNGKLSWNGKPIRLMMNGRDVFGGDGIIEQLPAEVAGKIKLYDRKSELARHTGKDDGDEDHVLDIQVKPGFLDKWYGDVDAKYMTKDHYYGRLFANRLSDKNPQIVYLMANNSNIKVEREDGYWFNDAVDKFGKDVFGAYNYQHNWNTKGLEKYANNRFYVSGSFGHADGWGTEYSTAETFFPNADRTFSFSRNTNSSHSLKPKFQAEIFAYTDEKNTLKLNLLASYEKTRRTSELSLEKQLNGEQVTLGEYYTSSEEEEKIVKAVYDWTHYIGRRGRLSVYGSTEFSDKDEESHINRDFDYISENTKEKLWQYGKTPIRWFMTKLNAVMSYWLSDKVYLSVGDYMSYIANNRKSDYFSDTDEANVAGGLPTTRDNDNWMRYDSHRFLNIVMLSSKIDVTKKFSVSSLLYFYTNRERGNMRYGSLDSTALRVYNFLVPTVTLKWKQNRAQNMDLSFTYNTDYSGMFDMFAWRNTVDPLNVKMGNPLLGQSHSHTTTYNYIRMWLRQQTTLNVTASYTKNINPIAAFYRYNSATGGYQSMSSNVKGGETYKLGLNFEQGIGVYIRVKNRANLSWGYSYGFLTAVDGEDMPGLNKLNRTLLEDNFEVSYDADNLNVSLYNNLRWGRYRYTDSAYDNSPFHTQVGANVRWSFKPFRLNVNVYDDFRSGYAASEMNRHRVIANASLDYTFCKNKCIIGLSADDIFNQNRSFDSSYNAYERTERWSKWFHHYVGVSFYYRFDAKK